MNSHSRMLAGAGALAAGLGSTLQLLEHDWLGGSTGLAVTATLLVLATGHGAW